MNKITFVIESLCEMDNPRALSAYHFIDQLSATGQEITVISINENKKEYNFKATNIQVLRPLKTFNLWQSFKAMSQMLNHKMDMLHIFAPFTSSSWKSMRELSTFALITKPIPHIKNSFSGYDPTFHRWSDKKMKHLENYFDIIYSHFNDKLPTDMQNPFVVPPCKNNSAVSNYFDPQYKYIYINCSFLNLWQKPKLLKTLEDFLVLFPNWKILVAKGWGNFDKFQILSQQSHWLNKDQFNRWIIVNEPSLAQSNLLLDLSKHLTERLFYIQQALTHELPIVTTDQGLKQHISWDCEFLEGLWFIKNFESSLLDKLLVVAENRQNTWSRSFQPLNNDSAINTFNRMSSQNQF